MFLGSPRLAPRAPLSVVSHSDSDGELSNFSKKEITDFADFKLTERLEGGSMSWSLGESTTPACGMVSAPVATPLAPPLELSSSEEDSSSSDEISERDVVHQTSDTVIGTR